MNSINDFSIQVATVNGSGSQSSNQILVRSIFRMGSPVGAKNLFPSNIAGLPTWFTIRVNQNGFTARTKTSEIVVAMNAQTLNDDLRSVSKNGCFIYNSDMKLDPSTLKRADVTVIGIPFKQIVADLSDSIQLKKLLMNMAYVGVLAELLDISNDILEDCISHQFKGKEAVISPNRNAVLAGRKYAQEHLQDLQFDFKVKAQSDTNENKILIDGNSAGALGLVFGGCTMAFWYPITPSSSLIENFSRFATKYRKDHQGQKTYSVIQAEDELASISMVIGAGWAGARAMTATSGPGLSLMAEAAGLAYYAEVPSVIWNVQRVGPSTGLPTRTMQGDLLTSYTLSHGDTKHVVLLPKGPEDCFEFGQTAFDLAERLQTLVIVLSDLDQGMNLHISNRFSYPEKALDRGKVISAAELEKMTDFGRYKDLDGDGIPYRALPGTEHDKAGYFTRGSGHDEYGGYTESPEVYKANMNRLLKKLQTAKTLVPKPIVTKGNPATAGVVYFGSTSECIPEVLSLLRQQGVHLNSMGLRALPFAKEAEEFFKAQSQIYVVEQNRDAQMANIIRMEYPDLAPKIVSILQYDGLPLAAEEVCSQILSLTKGGLS